MERERQLHERVVGTTGDDDDEEEEEEEDGADAAEGGDGCQCRIPVSSDVSCMLEKEVRERVLINREDVDGRSVEGVVEVCEREPNTSKYQESVNARRMEGKSVFREDVTVEDKDVSATKDVHDSELNTLARREDVTMEREDVLGTEDIRSPELNSLKNKGGTSTMERSEQDWNAFEHQKVIDLEGNNVLGKLVSEKELNLFKQKEEIKMEAKEKINVLAEEVCEVNLQISEHRKNCNSQSMNWNNVLSREEACKMDLNTLKDKVVPQESSMKGTNAFTTKKICERDVNTSTQIEDDPERPVGGMNVPEENEALEDVVGRSMEGKTAMESIGFLQQDKADTSIRMEIEPLHENVGRTNDTAQNLVHDMSQEGPKGVYERDSNTYKQIAVIPGGSMDENNVSAIVGLHQENQNSINECRSSIVSSIESIKVIGGVHTDIQESVVFDVKEETDSEEKDEDEDEEDIDFNPFLLQSPSPEGSSGLSSESEDLEDENESEGSQNHLEPEGKGLMEVQPDKQSDSIGMGVRGKIVDIEEQEDDIDTDDHTKKPSSIDCSFQALKDTESFSNGKIKSVQAGSHLEMGCGDEGACLGSYEDRAYILQQHSKDFTALSNLSSSSRDEDLDMNNTEEDNLNEEENVADAICRRTRAHYSLADMSLDELETFLQESDEEDYFQNVDDEEEYRKFVAAVQGSSVEGIGVNNQGGGKKVQELEEEEEDEEDDYDFEIELEEALESDYEEKCEEEVRKRKRQSGRGRKKDKRTDRERLLGSAKMPLRPLLPCGVLNDNTSGDTDKLLNERSDSGKSKSYGFTPCQRGQLRTLLHEHVQLLVQVLSLTVLDPSRQQIAVATQKILMQLVETRERILSWKSPPFPEICLCPPYIHASTSIIQPYSFTSDHGKLVSDGRCTESNPSKYTSAQGKICSLIDVPSLAVMKDFIADVAKAVEVFKQRRVQDAYNCKELVRKPLFPLPAIRDTKASVREPHQPKRTMAGALVQDTKLNGIALVPQEISRIVCRFTSLFNPDMFPHKPPPAALAKRLLFSEAEDELLAMGIMTYNTNWDKIQQNLLPSKTTHQIFVRQKNRSTSKAPENSIKAVRRLKNSPLTKEEQARIEEGLKIFKNDWTKVCEQCVPYRDPATLSRLWRAALGIQKSYSMSSEAKAKHRRNKKSAIVQDEDDTGEVNSGEETGGESTDVYLHEAFLTEWNQNENCFSTPRTHLPALQRASGSSSRNTGMDATCSHENHGTNLRSLNFVPNRFMSGERSLRTGNSSRIGKGKHQGSMSNLDKPIRTVKLAPGLPSLNLPPCVRVIPQSKFNNVAVDKSGGGSTKIHKLTVVRNASLMMPRQDPFISGTRGSECGLSASGTNCLYGASRDSSELGDPNGGSSSRDPSSAKMHPLLMQGTFESGVSNKNSTLYKAISGQGLPEDVPRFRPFFSVSKEKSVLSARIASKESVAAGLHPFLLEDADNQSGFLNTVRDSMHQSIRDAVDQTVSDTVHRTIRDTVHQIGSMIQYHNQVVVGHQEWPSVLSDSVIRPEPRRAIQVSYRQGEVSSSVQDQERQKKETKDLASTTSVEIRSPDPKKSYMNGDAACLLQERERTDTQLVQPCEEENIVMEQEELSDSEEDTDLGVQFEYEEIDDSERESSDNETPTTDKGAEGIEFEEEEIGSDDSNNDVE